jgi:NAD(P)-dependent dehydrogenase (short-subunit alcohol dehydrogenase family)
MTQKTAIVTGTSSGFGLLTTIELARAGFRVIATMRDLGRRGYLDQAAKAAGLLERIDVRTLDVTASSTIAPFIEKIVADYGRIDVLVNNAGFAMAGFIEDLSMAEIRKQFDTNFFGAVEMTKAVLPVMRKQGSGHIIMISSVGGLHGTPIISAYSASKHAMEGWSESLRLEVNKLGIRVSLIEPGAFATDIWTRNAEIGQKATDEASPNLTRALRMQVHIDKMPKADPLPVAQLIVRVAQDPNPRLRYLIGTDAKIQMFLKRLLPWKWHEKVVARALKIDA